MQVVGFCPENIMLVGDSAGGNLCLFLTRYLSYLSTSSRLDPTAESVLGLPCALCLISPWCDLSMQGSRFPSQQANAHADYLMDLDQTWFHASLRYYDLTKARKSVWFSPAMGSPADWEFLKDNGVRVFISYGSAERFMDEIVATAESMRQVGVNVQLYEVRQTTPCSSQRVPRALWTDFLGRRRHTRVSGSARKRSAPMDRLVEGV